jgi:transketolase
MALEDLAMMRAVHGSTVLYPSDANQTIKLVELMAQQPGISYLRTTREATAVLYPPEVDVRVGGSAVLKRSDADKAAVIAAGITVHEALRAYEQLQGKGVAIRIIDAYSVKPIDADTIAAAVKECGGNLVVVEDHWPEGGLGDAVLEAVCGKGLAPKVKRLAVRDMPGSGEPAELLGAAGIDAAHIAEAVQGLIA